MFFENTPSISYSVRVFSFFPEETGLRALYWGRTFLKCRTSPWRPLDRRMCQPQNRSVCGDKEENECLCRESNPCHPQFIVLHTNNIWNPNLRLTSGFFPSDFTTKICVCTSHSLCRTQLHGVHIQWNRDFKVAPSDYNVQSGPMDGLSVETVAIEVGNF
jgi:hypothetical protein